MFSLTHHGADGRTKTVHGKTVLAPCAVDASVLLAQSRRMLTKAWRGVIGFASSGLGSMGDRNKIPGNSGKKEYNN